MTKWEYKIARENPDRGEEGEKWLNAFGADGWEMISHRLVHEFYNEYLFKRPFIDDVKYPWPWHEFGDGVIPARDEQVEVKRRNGTIETGKASIFRWNEWGNDFDIVAWRLNG